MILGSLSQLCLSNAFQIKTVNLFQEETESTLNQGPSVGLEDSSRYALNAFCTEKWELVLFFFPYHGVAQPWFSLLCL